MNTKPISKINKLDLFFSLSAASISILLSIAIIQIFLVFM